MVRFDSAAAGTTAAEWATSGRLDSLPPLDLDNASSVTVVAAHPDDETLAAGGLTAHADMRGIPVRVISVTDGAHSHPRSATSAAQLREIRSREFRAAVRLLAPDSELVELGFPDGRTDEDRDAIERALMDAIQPQTTIVCPWRGDGHRDHRIVGEVCMSIAARRQLTLIEYPIWAWHWGTPENLKAPWSSGRFLALSPDERKAKDAALACYSSQIRGLGNRAGDEAVLTRGVLEHFEGEREIFFLTKPDLT